MTRPGAETIEIEPVHLFNLKDYRPLFTARQQAFFGDSVPGGGHLLFGARCGGEPAGAVWGGPDRNPGGLFLFDFNTVYKYETVIGDSTIAENRDDCSFIWENYYDGESGLNEYDLTIFLREEGELFRRFTETHVQRGYTLDAIRRLAEEAGLIWIKARSSGVTGTRSTI